MPEFSIRIEAPPSLQVHGSDLACAASDAIRELVAKVNPDAAAAGVYVWPESYEVGDGVGEFGFKVVLAPPALQALGEAEGAPARVQEILKTWATRLLQRGFHAAG